MPEKKVILIGAGVAGLAAGCYAQKNGFQSRIFELHDLPGGLCTAWERKSDLFNGCIPYLFGFGEGKPFNQLWQELGILKHRPIIGHAKLLQVSGPAGEKLAAYADPNELEAHMLAISPADTGLIHSLYRGIPRFADFDLAARQKTPKSVMSALDWL
jgi:phytoene dehydrogenase-like protein